MNFFLCGIVETGCQQSCHYTTIANKYVSIVDLADLGDLAENHFRHSLRHFNYKRQCTLLQKLSWGSILDEEKVNA